MTAAAPPAALRILLLCHSSNSLSQRDVQAAPRRDQDEPLSARGHACDGAGGAGSTGTRRARRSLLQAASRADQDRSGRDAEPCAARPLAPIAHRRRAADEAAKPLAAYRAEELARMQRNFYGFDPSYHVARHHFVHRKPHASTPRQLALHR